MLVDLVQTTTRDGFRLDGSFQLATASSRSTLGIDAVCFVHGTGSNFYASTLFDELAAPLLANGCSVLRINTRGHDGISTAAMSRGGRRLGAAYEVVDDCRHDLAAWVDWLRQRDCPRVGLVGHSLGAVKCLYALAHEPDLAVACAVAISPPRLSYEWFCASPEGPEFLTIFNRATDEVEAGKGATLLEVRLPLPMVISAAGYVEKYGPDERFNFLRFIGRVPCPVLVTLGGQELENNMAFRNLPDELAALAGRPGHRDVKTVVGADHFYSGSRRELAVQIVDCLRGNGPTPPTTSAGC